ncbi:hypothetical protein ACFVWG_24125 [Kribbella sp. NPDC058245]|uniref:hypothetical protein n=1 Tax=Kribbella sp. NPDC058245 TaxID=3346399 RepID=UPI0036E38C36
MPNERLAEVMRLAGLSNKALARRVQELATYRGRSVRCDHTSVSRWLAETSPRDATARLIAEVLSQAIGRTLTLSDIGLSAPEPVDRRLGLDYDSPAATRFGDLTSLWDADLRDAQIIVDAAPDPGAWSDSTLRWLLRDESGDTRHEPSPGAGQMVGVGDVASVRATVDAFASLDDSFGGGRARRALIQYLQTDLNAMLHGRFSDSVRPELFRAAAEGTLLAAWMSYDAGVHGLAQRYFIQALKLADFADDQLLGGSILDAMSHQATYLGRGGDAVNLARAARSGTRGIATPGLIAHFHAMEARALAVSGDASGAGKALNSAVRVYEKRQPGVEPDWISYFDDAELSAEFSHCFRDLGRDSDALTYSARAISGTSPRSDFFVKMVGAASQIGTRGTRGMDLEAACAAAAEAITSGAQLKSARCVRYVADFRRELAPHGNPAAVRELDESLEGNPLWEAAGLY